MYTATELKKTFAEIVGRETQPIPLMGAFFESLNLAGTRFNYAMSEAGTRLNGIKYTAMVTIPVINQVKSRTVQSSYLLLDSGK